MYKSSLFTERLAELMFDDSINAPKLANKIGVHRTTITRYLSCNKVPNLQNMIALADYFNCTIDFLVCLDNENYQTTFKPCPPFNERLAYLFKHYKKSKSGLHKEKDISETVIFSWLRGDDLPSLDNVIKLAEYFGCSIDYVVGRDN